MVYKRYIKKRVNGELKTFGPYYYESYRDKHGITKTRYVSKPENNFLKRAVTLFLLIFISIFIILLFVFLFNSDLSINLNKININTVSFLKNSIKFDLVLSSFQLMDKDLSFFISGFVIDSNNSEISSDLISITFSTIFSLSS